MKTVLFMCVHNAGRSQIAEALTNHLARQRGLAVHAVSAGTVAGDRINPTAVEVMREIGVPMEGQHPKPITPQMVDQADRTITMGCGVDTAACPVRLHLTEDWGLDDPAGQPIEKVRVVRDQIRRRVESMLDEMSREDR